MTIQWEVAIWAIGLVFVGGGMYSDVRTRLGRMEKMLGNGHPGVFVRHDELAQIVKNKDESHVQLHARYDEMGARLHDLETR